MTNAENFNDADRAITNVARLDGAVPEVRLNKNIATNNTDGIDSSTESKAQASEQKDTIVETTGHRRQISKTSKTNDPDLPRLATQDEIRNLPKVAGKITLTIWLLIFTGSSTSFARYAVSTPFQNYVQNPPGNPSLPGVLGLGQDKATIIQNFYFFFVSLTPLPMGIISDAWLGRYRTMLLSIVLLVAGYILIVLTSLPVAVEAGAGLGGLIAGIVVAGFGQGGLFAIMFVFIGDQIPEERPTVIKKKGREVVVDRKVTIQFVFNAYFWAGNIASLSMIPPTCMERELGFWQAYLMGTSVLFAGAIPVILWNKRLVKLPPEGNILPQASQVLLIATRSGFRLSAAEPSSQDEQHGRGVPWSSEFVQEIGRGLRACRVMIPFIIFWLCYNQSMNNTFSQGGQMKMQGFSNDTNSSLNVIAAVVMTPLAQKFFSFLHSRKISFPPILRMTIGFAVTAIAIGYAAAVKKIIYSRGLCYSAPLVCPAAIVPEHPEVRRPNHVSMWLQTPIYMILAVAEILSFITVTECAYSEAPLNMKSIVQTIAQLTAATGAALGIALGPVSKDSSMIIVYRCLAGVMGITALLFWLVFRRLDKSSGELQIPNSGDGKEP